MNPTQLNLPILQSSSYLLLDQSAKYLVSRTGNTLHRWDTIAGKAGSYTKPSFIKKVTFGSLTLSWTTSWLTISDGIKGTWGINTARFAGTPKLKIESRQNNSEILITLTGARFPGLDLSADLAARLFFESGVETMDLQFPFCGFSSRVALKEWLATTSPATGLAFFDDEICRITAGVNLRAGGSIPALFTPSWLFVFSGTGYVADLTAEGKTISSRTLVLALLAPGMPSALFNPANRRSALFIPEQEPFDLPLWPERTEGWRFLRPFAAFRSLTIEADEQTNGDVRRAIVAAGLPENMIFFQPGADLLNDYMEPFSIPLQKPLYGAVYKKDGTRLAASLMALRTPLPLTVHTGRCSLALGPVPRKPGFLLLDLPALGGNPATLYLGPLPSGSVPLQHGLHFSLLATAPRPGEIVVDPLPPLVASTMLLSIAPINRELAPTEGEINCSDTDPFARLRLPEFSWTQIVRPRDLMVLGLQFLGLRPEFHGTAPGRLFQSSKDVPRIVVYFPPQSIGELTFKDDPTTTDDSVPPTPINYRTAGLSRLAFDFREGITEIPYTLEELLNWDNGNLKPRLDNRALTPAPALEKFRAKPGILKAKLADGWVLPVTAIEKNFTPQRPPLLDMTAIEAPYRLILSPDQYGRWETAISAAMSSGKRAVLWHARLKTTTEAPPPPVVRAIWSVDNTPGVTPDPFQKNASLTKVDRTLLVANSTLKAVDAKKAMLTSLGAWLNLEGDWSQFSEDEVTLEKWLHRSTLGRDQFVQVVKRGYLYPFGHRAVQIEITERKFGQNPPGRVGAWLRKRTFIVVREFERNYDQDQSSHGVFPSKVREIPFKSVRLLTKVTPVLNDPALITLSPPPTGDEFAYWPMINSDDYLFNLSATDKEGRLVEFSAPLAFVSSTLARNAAYVSQVIDNQLAMSTPEGRRRYQFRGQKLFFAAAKEVTDEPLEAATIAFKGFFRKIKNGEPWARPFYPQMTSAEVAVPAMRQFGDIHTPQAISYFTGYLNNGFSGSNSQGQIYATFTGGVSITYGGSNKTDKVGGMISPGMLASGLSRAHGIVGSSGGTGAEIENQLNNFASGTFNPGDYFGGTSAKILGGIDLFKILLQVGNFASGGDLKIPQWINTVKDGKISRSFTWKTDQLEENAGTFASVKSSSLEITCNVQLGPGAGTAHATLSATLVAFTITLADVIRIPFKQFSMQMDAGRKPEVNVDIGKIEFIGALGFVSAIQDNLHLDRFTDPPSLDITAEGLSIAYGIQIPSIQIGIFALQNLALNASATLPFTGDPFRARFALSERQNPFLISVSLFTGGGFFAIGVGLDGVESLEVSLEFGGNISLDIGVASGGVHVMAGIYIKISKEIAELTGYVRAGGSLNVLGLISISVEFYLGITYEAKHNKAWGEASMTVEISILFFSIDVTLTVRREFAGDAADPTLQDTLTESEWNNEYIAAFAA